MPARYRQLLQRALFLAVIIAPCAVLVTLSLRLIAQDRELADKRAQDSRRLAVAEIAAGVTTRLDHLRLEALAGGLTSNPGVHAIALVAPLQGERLVLPWDDATAQSKFRSEISLPQFASAIVDAERAEYVTGDRSAAHAGYLAALGIARSPEQRAVAALAALRTASAGKADRLVRPLLQSTVVDEEGVPVSLYAARILLARDVIPEGVHQIIAALSRALNRVPPLNLVGLHMVQSVAESPGLLDAGTAASVSTLRADAAARLAVTQQARDLQASFAGLAALHDRAELVWMPFGADHDLWLVTVTESPITKAATVVAIRANVAIGTDVALGRRRGALFEPLGLRYPGLFARVPVQPITDGESVRTVLIGVVVLTLAIALLGSWFFWRDVQRDLRLAELRSQFVASVSHELKTPLTAIRMFAETLRLGRTPAERTAEYLDTIVSESERLTRLMNNVLDFSRVEQGTRRYHLTPQSLAPIVRSAARTMRYPLERDAFDLNVAIDDEHLQARCDADALEQAILNLLSNAMKYSGANRSIQLRLTPKDASARIIVEDHGIGIPAAEQSRIFEKFYRGSADAHQRVAGTGLGLTLVQHTVRAHGGSVSVESSPGVGSTFTILLPIVAARDPASVSDLADVAHDATPWVFRS